MKKQMIPCLYLQYEKAVTGFGQRNLLGDGDVRALGRFYKRWRCRWASHFRLLDQKSRSMSAPLKKSDPYAEQQKSLL